MQIEKIIYTNYRNIENAEIIPEEGVNVFCGYNAQGKTNLLEGIYYFACGKSFRLAKDGELVTFGRDRAGIDVRFRDKDRTRHHRVDIPKTERKSCFKEEIRVGRMSDFIGVFRAVLFSPEHLSIVKEGPAERRAFADVAISQLYPLYMASLSRYQKILSQRNSLLKDPGTPGFCEMLYVLSEQLAGEAELISKHRKTYFDRINSSVGEIISDMTAGKEKVSIIYNGEKSREEFLDKLTGNREKEISAGLTLYGTHKDDVLITLNGKDSRYFASQGQQRSIALAMKLAEGEVSRAITGEYPVFLFDDILSELDSKRKEYVLSGLTGMQVFITCCEEVNYGKIFYVSSGKATESTDPGLV